MTAGTTTGNEWQDWGRKEGDGEERWKPSQNVGALVRLTIRGYKEVDTQYGEWKFVEADVDVIEPGGKAFTTFAEVPLSGAWYVSTFKGAPSGYQAFGVVTREEYAKGTGYAMRPMTDDERATVNGALPAY